MVENKKKSFKTEFDQSEDDLCPYSSTGPFESRNSEKTAIIAHWNKKLRPLSLQAQYFFKGYRITKSMGQSKKGTLKN
jgi:hypothetical protein